jgi:hypothetical protein
MKVPSHLYATTIHFYRHVIGLTEITSHAPSVGFRFGSNQLWIDDVPGLSQAETWLEVLTDDVAAASKYLKTSGIVRCDAIEPLPEGFQGFWISSPASIIHLVCKDSAAW